MNTTKSCGSEGSDAGEYLLFKHIVLELLLTQDLSALLTTANQIRHDLVSWTKRQVFEDFKVLLGEGVRDLV